MNVTIEEINNTRKKLTIEVPAETVDTEIEKAYQKVSKTAKLKGFRPGKVPRHVLESTYGDQVTYDVVQTLISQGYMQATMEKEVVAVGQPEIVETDQPQKGEAFKFVAEVDVKPEVELQTYKGLSFDKEAYTFDEERVTQQLDQMAMGKATLEPVDRDAAEEGDTVIIDFTGYKGGEAFENGAATDYQLELGSNSFIPGFEDAIVGMKKDETKSIDLTFPEEYGAKDLAGQDVTFETVLKEIKVKVPAELTDEFAKDFGSDGLDDLKSKLREQMEGEDLSRVKHEFEDRVRAALVEANPVEVPETMVTAQLDAMFGNFKNNVESQGMKLEMLGLDRQKFDTTYHEAAVTRVQSGLILEAVGKAEEIKVEKEDFDAKIDELVERTKTDKTVIENHFKDPNARRMVYSEIFDDKVITFLAENGTVNELSKEEIEAKLEKEDDTE